MCILYPIERENDTELAAFYLISRIYEFAANDFCANCP